MKDLYVYGITSNEIVPGHFRSQGVEFGGQVEFLPYKDLMIAVSRVERQLLDENEIKQRLQQDLEWTKRNVQAHHNVIMEIARKATTIPMRFATLFHSRKNLEKMLQQNYLELKDLLFFLAGKQEIGIKVYLHHEKVKEMAIRQKMAGHKAGGDPAGQSKGMKWFLEKKQQQQAEEKLHQFIEDTLRQIFETLDCQAARSALNQPLPADPLSEQGEMVLNAAFLVKDSSLEKFQSIAGKLAKEMGPAGFDIEITGPWPPYNFATIHSSRA